MSGHEIQFGGTSLSPTSCFCKIESLRIEPQSLRYTEYWPVNSYYAIRRVTGITPAKIEVVVKYYYDDIDVYNSVVLPMVNSLISSMLQNMEYKGELKIRRCSSGSWKSFGNVRFITAEVTGLDQAVNRYGVNGASGWSGICSVRYTFERRGDE